jgi:hypothetical protein
METIPPSQPADLAVDVQYITTTTTTTSTPANTAAPGIYETITTLEQLDHIEDTPHHHLTITSSNPNGAQFNNHNHNLKHDN